MYGFPSCEAKAGRHHKPLHLTLLHIRKSPLARDRRSVTAAALLFMVRGSGDDYRHGIIHLHISTRRAAAARYGPHANGPPPPLDEAMRSLGNARGPDGPNGPVETH